MDLVSTFWIPADSTTARTAPPAMMPVPSGAGLSSTDPAPNRPSTGAGSAVPALRTPAQRMGQSRSRPRHANGRLLRRLDPLLDGRRHFLRLADPEPAPPVLIADD